MLGAASFIFATGFFSPDEKAVNCQLCRLIFGIFRRPGLILQIDNKIAVN